MSCKAAPLLYGHESPKAYHQSDKGMSRRETLHGSEERSSDGKLLADVDIVVVEG